MKPRVWAPFAREQVEIEVEGRRERMQRQDGDWYVAERDLPAGTLYFFCVDGGPPTPDPRSRSQPQGVHGPSRVEDERFEWTDARFRARPLSSAVIYELHIGCFSEAGTFEGAVAHLDHLVELGVTHVELLPVVEAHGVRGWGYDGVDLFAPHHAYGGPRALKALVDACHARDLAVIIDVVYNHLGPTGNYLDRFGPYFTDEHKTLWGRAINFDQRGSHEVRRFFVDNALMWLEEFHADGLRLDAVHAFYDSSAVTFLEELGREVRALEARVARPLVVIAESDLNDPRVLQSCDAQWSDDYHHALHALLTKEQNGYYEDFGKIGDVAHALERGFVYDGRFSKHRGRVHGRPLHDVPLHRLLGYLQTHDQVGNRARGDRFTHIASIEHAMIGAALYLLSPFTPMIFMGEEWAASSPFLYFCDQEEHLAEIIRDGRRREFASFGWKPEDIPDPQDAATFERSKLVWAERERDEHARVLEWYRSLIRLRPRACGPCRAIADDQAQTLIVRRPNSELFVNLSSNEVAFTSALSTTEISLASKPARRDGERIRLAPLSVALVAA